MLKNPPLLPENPPQIGILLTNLGTPDSLKTSDIRRYLATFLADSRVVESPNRLLWWLILHFFILNFRVKHTQQKYRKIWDTVGVGSPLLSISKSQLSALQSALNQDHQNLKFALAMRYGEPSISAALQELQAQNCQKIIILPLYPQYSSTTSASTYDAVSLELKHWRVVPSLVFIQNYHQNPAYIEALSASITNHQNQHGKPDKLIISYHGIPQRYIDSGDPYQKQCHQTTALLAKSLNLKKTDYQTSFQSIFGREKWTEPHTDITIKTLAQQGIKHIQVICPGFSSDCLETLEEINQENRQIFTQNGGKTFHYIPALNTQPQHIQALKSILTPHL